jgi:hypothetical protein
VAHQCGHDIHIAAILGVATVLVSMRAELPGTENNVPNSTCPYGAPQGYQSGRWYGETGAVQELPTYSADRDRTAMAIKSAAGMCSGRITRYSDKVSAGPGTDSGCQQPFRRLSQAASAARLGVLPEATSRFGCAKLFRDESPRDTLLFRSARPL